MLTSHSTGQRPVVINVMESPSRSLLNDIATIGSLIAATWAAHTLTGSVVAEIATVALWILWAFSRVVRRIRENLHDPASALDRAREVAAANGVPGARAFGDDEVIPQGRVVRAECHVRVPAATSCRDVAQWFRAAAFGDRIDTNNPLAAQEKPRHLDGVALFDTGHDEADSEAEPDVPTGESSVHSSGGVPHVGRRPVDTRRRLARPRR